MTIQQQQFLELLRAGLWGYPADTALFQSNVDWETIFRIAHEQTVQVIIFDGIETLPQEMWPPKEFIFRLMMVRIKTKQMHTIINKTINRITQALNSENIPSILLKGQGVAQNYRKPESRMCGDIDLYVGLGGYEKACETIIGLTNDLSSIGECDYHTNLKIDNIEVEIHKMAEKLLNTSQNKIFQNWTFCSIDKNFLTANLRVWDNEGTDIYLAPETFNAFFILHHAVRHMTKEGVGLRQICDWVMFLHKNNNSINIEELKMMLTKLNMQTVWKEFGHLAIDHLGLPKNECPLSYEKLNSKKTEKLINQIFISGNFGRFDTNAKDYSKTTYIKRKWRSFIYQSSRLLKLFSLFPNYAISFWWGWLTNGVRVFLKGE